jgi:hypothetical protein
LLSFGLGGFCKQGKIAGFIQHGVVFFPDSENRSDWNSPKFGKYNKFETLCKISPQIRALIFVYFFAAEPEVFTHQFD